MIYQKEVAIITAKKWKVSRSTVRRWERSGILPDCRVFGEPLDRAGLATEKKLIGLIESGWIKSRSIGSLIGAGDRVNALMTARRYPDNPKYHVRHLSADEIKQIGYLLDKFTRELGTLLYMVSLVPDGQNYSNVVQTDLRALLQRSYLNTANIRAGMNERQESRFWAFMRGQSANREDLDRVLGKLRLLAVLLID